MENNKSLESLIYEVSYNLAENLDKNKIDKLLGVLSNDGVYAMWVYAKSKSDIKEVNLFNKLECILAKIDNTYNGNPEEYIKEVSKDITKLLFLKQVLEQVLIYARYHAKAKNDN